MRFRILAVIAAIAAVAGSASPALAGRPPESPGLAAGQLTAQIRYTTGGIPHILARNWADLGFGYGYAFAKDNLCTMANGYVTVEAQRSRYFGPKGSYIESAVENNLESDIFWQQIINSHIVQQLVRGLSPAEKQLEAGYVKGYNGYLAHVGGAKGVPDPTCRGKSWVKPITLQDSYLRFYQLMLELSGDKAIQGITEAAPPTAAQATHPAAASPARTARALAAAWPAPCHKPGAAPGGGRDPPGDTTAHRGDTVTIGPGTRGQRPAACAHGRPRPPASAPEPTHRPAPTPPGPSAPGTTADRATRQP